MPIVSKAMNRAMHAAKAGNSTLGIPQKVGAEFIEETPPGGVKSLPERAPKKPPGMGNRFGRMRDRGLISDTGLAAALSSAGTSAPKKW